MENLGWCHDWAWIIPSNIFTGTAKIGWFYLNVMNLELILARISNIGYKILRFYELEKEQTEFGNGIWCITLELVKSAWMLRGTQLNRVSG